MRASDRQPADWQDLQNIVAEIFREIGCVVRINERVKLARGKKDIDVYVEDAHIAPPTKYLCECKNWNRRVPKETVHTFRSVVSDFGANRGFIISKKGFQPGAYEAAAKTNLDLVTLEEFRSIFADRLKRAEIQRRTLRVRQTIEKMRYGWHPAGDHSAVDGEIDLLYRGESTTGRKIYVLVRDDPKTAPQRSDSGFSVAVDLKDVAYWRELRAPIIVVWHAADQRPMYWGRIPRSTTDDASGHHPGFVLLERHAKFGIHSKMDLYRFWQNWHGTDRDFPSIVVPNTFNSSVKNVKAAAYEFYDAWRKEPVFSPAFGDNVAITLRGWRHITAARRTQHSIVRRLELLGAAREILSKIEKHRICRQVPPKEQPGSVKRVYYMQTARLRYQHRGDAIVSVITERVNEGPFTFYSVFEHRARNGVGKR